ncbi:hypothetical protein ACHAWU_009145 [Discostella pseudostelligera]|uniref:Palmitoyltransferase n=1 Tax=Discostella pseudostelligera TaxID=259834 RepID=A0ABD3NBZ6_9STRA
MAMTSRRMPSPNRSTNSVGGIVYPGRYNGHKTMSSLEIADDDDCELQLGEDVTNTNKSSSSMDEKYHLEREQAKLRHWKESEHAAGLVEPTWGDELEAYRRKGCCCPDHREAMSQMFHDEIDPGCGCIYLSALICSRLGAGRIGNMAVLKERYVMVEADDDDGDEDVDEQVRADGFVDDDGEEEDLAIHQRNNISSNNSRGKTATKTKQLVRKREIQLVVGPFWPMLLFITYPLIFGVSAFTLYTGLPGKPMYVQIVWALLTLQLIRSLFNTGFRDPGILQRRTRPPPVKEDDSDNDHATRRIGFRWGNEDGAWRWSDQAQSYRPKNSMFCPDCKVVIEEFDHTCPWTGTAIGKKNMRSFQMFVGLIFICLIMDIFLLTAGAMM